MPYWIDTGSKQHGPFNAAQLKKLALKGELKSSHKISTDQKRWVVAESVKGLGFHADEKQTPPSRESSSQSLPADSTPMPTSQTPLGGKPCDAVFDEANRLLETQQRTLAIGECRVRLGCEFDTAREIIRLIESKTPRADVIEAMEKAAAGVPITKMQTSTPDNLPPPPKTSSALKYVQYLENGKAVVADIETIRTLLLDCKLTGRDLARCVEPRPDVEVWYDWRNTATWEKRRDWRPIEKGIGKEAFRLRLLYDPRGLFRELAMSAIAIAIFVTMVPAVIWAAYDELASALSATGNSEPILVQLGRPLVSIVAMVCAIPFGIGLGMLLVGLPIGRIAYLCCAQFLPKLPEGPPTSTPEDATASQIANEDSATRPSQRGSAHPAQQDSMKGSFTLTELFVVIAIVGGLLIGACAINAVWSSIHEPGIPQAVAIPDWRDGDWARYIDPKARFTCDIPPGWDVDESKDGSESNVTFTIGQHRIAVTVRHTEYHEMYSGIMQEMTEGMKETAVNMGPDGKLGEVTWTTLAGSQAIQIDLGSELNERFARTIKAKHKGWDHFIGVYIEPNSQKNELCDLFAEFLTRYE